MRQVLSAQVVLPSLATGARGPSVLALERRLAELRYALRGVDGVYGHDTFEAVLAFQKVHGLPRTGRVEPWLWRRLSHGGHPARRSAAATTSRSTRRARCSSSSAAARCPASSTSPPARPATRRSARWSVYRKVGGWDWVLWYPLYFKGGFAIHGYPSVPAYPASHGCVRIPMWIAPSLFGTHGYGTDRRRTPLR